MSLQHAPLSGRRSARILVIEDDERVRRNIVEFLAEEGYDPLSAETGTDGLALASARAPDLVICDIMLPGIDGYTVLERLRAQNQRLPLIFLTARAERADMRKGMNLGADDYLTKPFTLAELHDAIQTRLRRLEEGALRAEVAAAEEGPSSGRAPAAAFAPGDGIVVLDPAMLVVYEQLTRLSVGNMAILILGERGAGKDVVARAVHNLSPRRKGPFLALNCAALNESLLEAELFGSEKGAYTGSVSARPGLFEAASGGTIFLDEVGELPTTIQAKLLRVLEDRQVIRLGARTAREVDVRFVAATNRDIEGEAERGSFRADLFDRISGAIFTIPPLRERPLEIAALARVFVARAAAEHGRPGTLAISPDCLQVLQRHPWPGNVRELRNAMHFSVALAQGDTIQVEHLPPKLRAGVSAPSSAPAARGLAPSSDPLLDAREQLRRHVETEERRQVLEALAKSGGNQTRAAELLGIARRTLLYRMQALGIHGPRKKPHE